MRSRLKTTGKGDSPNAKNNSYPTYYKFKGWNQDGVPTKERLLELDLGYVAEDLEKRGILKDGQE